MNLVFGLLVLGLGAGAVWTGFVDPEGGLVGGIRATLGGQPVSKHVSTTAAAYVNAVASSAGVVTGGTAGGGAPVNAGPVAGSSGARAAVLNEAKTWLGVPYRFGGNDRRGVDCSGFTRAVFATVGVKLPRVSALQALAGQGIPLTAAQPGDLVCFGGPVHHVGIYVGAGNIIHAPHTGTVVRYEAIWHTEPVTVRRVLA